MKTLEQIAANPSGFDSWANYAGERPDPALLVVMTRSRDSDILTEVNWECALETLGGEDESAGVEIHRFGHWACGWWEALCVRQGSDKEDQGARIVAALDNYPVLNEERWSDREWETYAEHFEQNAQSELARGLRDYIAEASEELIESAPIDVLREWFESCIPSGEYYCEGAYPNFCMVCRDCTRADIARLLRAIRAANRQHSIPTT